MWIICRKTYDVTWSNTLIAIWYCCGKWYCWKKPIYFCVALNRGVRGHFVSPFSHNRPVSARFSFLIRSPLMYHYNVINGRLTLVSWYIKWSHLWARLTDQIFEDVSPIFPFQRGETWFNIHERNGIKLTYSNLFCPIRNHVSGLSIISIKKKKKL